MFRLVALAILSGWTLAALSGWAPAAADYATGVRYWGRGDFASAAREFLPAAQAGDAEAQYMMGRLYSLGDGVSQDFVQAWVWFDRAARQRHAMAAEARAGLERVLNATQLAQARGADRPQVAQAAPPRVTPSQPVQGRSVVLVPRQGVVASRPARLVAPGATVEGNLLASGDLSQRVREVQMALNRAGYYDGPADGTLAPATRQAIRAYQRDTGLPQTGLLSTRLVERLAEAERRTDQQQAAR